MALMHDLPWRMFFLLLEEMTLLHGVSVHVSLLVFCLHDVSVLESVPLELILC